MVPIQHRINYKSRKDVIKIKPLFDAHLGSTLCDTQAIRKFLSDDSPNTYYFIGGDLCDEIVVKDPRYSKIIDDSGPNVQAVLNHQFNEAKAMLEPVAERGQLIGIGTGNHEQTCVKNSGFDMTAMLCEQLGVHNLGMSGFIRLQMRQRGGMGRTVTIKWHHGYGGNSTSEGYLLTKYSKELIYYDADIFLFGHNHQLKSTHIDTFGMVGNRVVPKRKLVGVCGCWKKSMHIGPQVTWEETKGFFPRTIGGLTACIKPTSDWVDLWFE